MKYVCGLLACDGTETRTAKHLFDAIWFLNLASAYRDMMAEDLYGKFVLENQTPDDTTITTIKLLDFQPVVNL